MLISSTFHTTAGAAIVNVLTRYGLEDWQIGVQLPAAQIVPSPHHPDHLSRPVSLPSSGYRG